MRYMNELYWTFLLTQITLKRICYRSHIQLDNKWSKKTHAIYFAILQIIYTFDMQLNRTYKKDE